MALPTLDKTWQFNVNQVHPGPGGGNTLGTNQTCLLAMKNTLTGFALNPWTVRGSSNGTTAAMDGVDRWVSTGSLNWGSGAHSWIVLRQAGISSNFELLIDLGNTSLFGSAITKVVTTVGFTGGTTTARPTAVDEQVIVAAGGGTTTAWGGISAGSTANLIHGMQSTDGQVTYLFHRFPSPPTTGVASMLGFGRPKNPSTGPSSPFFAFWHSTSNSGSNTQQGGASTLLGTNPLVQVAGGMIAHFATEKPDNLLYTDNVNYPNDLSGEYPMFPLSVAARRQGVHGRIGQVPDLWLGLSSLTTGDTYPNDTSRQFVQMGTYIAPWDGSVVTLT